MYILQYYTTYLTSCILHLPGHRQADMAPVVRLQGQWQGCVAHTGWQRDAGVQRYFSLNKESESGWFVQRWGGKQFHTSWHCCLTLYQSYADVYLYFVFLNLSPRLKSSHQVTVRKKTVDATRMETKVPSTTKPNFTVEVNFTIVHVHQNCSSNIKPNRMESTLFLSTASPEFQNPGRGEN